MDYRIDSPQLSDYYKRTIINLRENEDEYMEIYHHLRTFGNRITGYNGLQVNNNVKFLDQAYEETS